MRSDHCDEVGKVQFNMTNKEHCIFKAVNLTATTISQTGNKYDEEE